MTDKLATEIQRGLQAKELLEHPLLNAAFEHIEKEIFDVWQQEKSSPEQRETLWQRGRAIQLLKAYLQKTLNDGKIAEKEVERRNA